MSYWRSPRVIRREARRALAYGTPSTSPEVNAAALSYSTFALIASWSIILTLLIAGVVEASLIGPRSSTLGPVIVFATIPATQTLRRRTALLRAMRRQVA